MSSNHIYGVSPSSDSTSPYNYLYRITNIVEQKYYYGIRTSKKLLPQDDLGTKYFSSSRDKKFKSDQKEHPENYQYKIIIICNSRERLCELEVKIHRKFKVGINPKFYNRIAQNLTGLDPTGHVVVRDAFGNTSLVPLNDEQYLNGTLQSTSKGRIIVKDNEGNYHNVLLTDPLYLNGILQPAGKGKVTVRDSEGNTSWVSKTNPLYLNGTLVSNTTGNVVVRDSEGKTFWVSKDDPRLLDGTVQSTSKGRVNVKDSDGKTFAVPINHPDYISGILQPIFKGQVVVKDKFGKRIMVPVDDPRISSGELEYNTKGQVTVRDSEGNCFNVLVDDERFINGELKSIMKGRQWIHNPTLNKNARIKANEPLPEGWEYGHKVSKIKHYKKTPWGIFESANALEPEINCTTVYSWCGRRNDHKVSKNTYDRCKKLRETFGPDCIGKTFKELGFANLTPEEYNQLPVEK